MLSKTYPKGWRNADESIKLGNLSISYAAVLNDLMCSACHGDDERKLVIKQLKSHKKKVDDFRKQFDETHREIMAEPYDFNWSQLLVRP